jgi:hypothetical protein
MVSVHNAVPNKANDSPSHEHVDMCVTIATLPIGYKIDSTPSERVWLLVGHSALLQKRTF